MANEYLPFPTCYTIQLPLSVDPQTAKDTLNAQLTSLDLTWTWNAETSSGIGEACQNVWSRAYRRAHERKKRQGVEDMNQGDGENKVELAFRIKVVDLAREVDVEWLRGADQVLWESFCGLMHRHFKIS